MTENNNNNKGSTRDGRNEDYTRLRRMMERYSKEIKSHKVTKSKKGIK